MTRKTKNEKFWLAPDLANFGDTDTDTDVDRRSPNVGFPMVKLVFSNSDPRGTPPQAWDIRRPPPQGTTAHLPAPEPERRRHARTRARAPDTCRHQSQDSGDRPWPEPAEWRHASARTGPAKTCLLSWPEPGRRPAPSGVGDCLRLSTLGRRRPCGRLGPRSRPASRR